MCTPSLPTAPEERQVYVADEKNGTWAPATQMPGLAALNVRDWSGVNSMSGTSAGTCAAGGFYEDSLGIAQAFVINEAHGTWGQAIELPGTAALDKGSESPVVSVSCVSAGNCVAGGYYVSYEGRYHVHLRAFVADQTGGVWRRAEQVPGTAALEHRRECQGEHGVLRTGRKLRARRVLRCRDADRQPALRRYPGIERQERIGDPMRGQAGLTRLDRPWHRQGAARYALARLLGLLRPPVEVYEPASGSPEVLRDLPVAVRDGTVLRVNVVLPTGGGRFPVLMSAHPYGKDHLPTRRGGAGGCRSSTGSCGRPAGCGSRR